MMIGAVIIFFGVISAQAQQPPEGQAAPPPASANPATADNPNQQPPPNPQPAPAPPPQQPPPQAQPMPEGQPPQGQPPQNQAPSAPPLMTPLPPSLSSGASGVNIKKLQQAAANRIKSPFMIPNELYLKLLKKKGDNQAEVVDLSVEPRRRWALKYYRIVAVIWNVKNPKAMIADKEGKMHLYKEKDYIANQEGFITEINNGEVVVLERGTEHKLKLTK